MQTLTINIQDNFLAIIEPYGDKIQLKKDKNLEIDPYFYERQKELHKTRDDIKNGNIEMVSHETLWGSIKNSMNLLGQRVKA